MMYLSRSLFACLAMVVGVTGCVDTRSESGKNVILFLGDGMGVSTVTAARIFEGQSRGENGEENFLSFEEFPHVALVKTYNVDGQVSDSAGTMTAIMTGVKARVGAISVGPEASAMTVKLRLTTRYPRCLKNSKIRVIERASFRRHELPTRRQRLHIPTRPNAIGKRIVRSRSRTAIVAETSRGNWSSSSMVMELMWSLVVVAVCFSRVVNQIQNNRIVRESGVTNVISLVNGCRIEATGITFGTGVNLIHCQKVAR